VHAGYRPQSFFWGWVAAAGLVGLLWLARLELLANGYVYRGGFSLVGLFSALLIAGAIWSPPQALMRRALSIAPLCWIGKISYGLYLWHWPVIRAMADYPLDPTLKILLELVATFAIATASFYLIEEHFLRLKDRIGQLRIASYTLIGAMAHRDDAIFPLKLLHLKIRFSRYRSETRGTQRLR
jgi:peptidoglycan/LPS O-acetylase OafA/YrhL